MSEHLRQGWALRRQAATGARFQHTFLPEDPYAAHAALMALTQQRQASRRVYSSGTYDRDRIHDLVANEGFSHHPLHGSAPSSGFMASYDADEGSPEAAVHHISEIGPEHIAAHRGAISHHLNQPSSYQGGWHDTATGDVYLDASKHFHDESEVRNFAADQKQKAYFKLDDFSERFMHPKQDPLAMKDHDAWKERYANVGEEPHPRFQEYGHKYPATDEQKQFWEGRGHHLGGRTKDQTEFAGRPMGAFRSDTFAEQELARRRGYLG